VAGPLEASVGWPARCFSTMLVVTLLGILGCSGPVERSAIAQPHSDGTDRAMII
jgi:hypothetical protein